MNNEKRISVSLTYAEWQSAKSEIERAMLR